MERRQFIRLIGGGLVLATAPGGCGPAGPDPRAAWVHPGQGEHDPRRRALAYALLAPNPHNMQPWLADLREPGRITLYIDRSRLLPVTDPFNRQITIGCGAFLELLRMAAAVDGLAVQITPFPRGEPFPTLDDRPIAQIDFGPGGRPDPLFGHALQRRTSRVPFKDTPLPADVVGRITRSAEMPGIAVAATLDPARLRRLRAMVLTGAEIEAHTPAAHHESAERTFFGARQVAEHRYGISIEGPAIEALVLTGLATQAKMATPGTIAYQQSLAFMPPLANTAQGFAWLITNTNTGADQLAAGQAYLRMNTQAAAEQVAMHPWSQGLQEYATMAVLFQQLHRELAPLGGRIQMLVRMGYAQPVPPAPRRGLNALLKV